MPVFDLIDHFNALYRPRREDAPRLPRGSATPATPAASVSFAGEFFLAAGNRVEARAAGLRLASAFQPIFAAASGRVLSHEALLRPWREAGTSASGDPHCAAGDGQPVSPEEVFVRSGERGDIVHLDRLCRTLHTINFSRQIGERGERGEGPGELFLNIHPRHLLEVSSDHGAYFESVLARCGLAPHNVVLEILESSVNDLPRLQAALANYQRRGFRIAIDDFGRSHSNFDRLWLLQPDIVKLDRSLIAAASANERVRRVLPRLVNIIHELDALTVCEGIETPEQLALARAAGVNALQGYLLGRPAPDCRRSGFVAEALRAGNAAPEKSAPLRTAERVERVEIAAMATALAAAA